MGVITYLAQSLMWISLRTVDRSIELVDTRMRQCEDRCHNSMHSYVNLVSKSVNHGSNALSFLVFYQSWFYQTILRLRFPDANRVLVG